MKLPDNQSDIFRALVFSTKDGSDKEIELSHRGDGIKSIHIPAILKYISEYDLKLRGPSAIPVTTIWGYEEPENGIELLKSFDLAEDLYSFSKNLQMLITTHSPAFYSLNSKEKVKTFFVSKNDKYQSVFSDHLNNKTINEKIGMMPLLAPYIKEQAELVEKAKEIFNKNYLTDVPTIMLEGETDVEILTIAIKEHSNKLQSLLDKKHLRIITKNDGAGCKQLSDWALAWIFSGFKSKLYILFDNDKAGKDARGKILNNEIYKTNQNNSNMKIALLSPSDIIKGLYRKKVKPQFEIEHLLSLEFWELLKEKNYVEPLSIKELQDAFEVLITRSKTLDNIIEDTVDDIRVRDTVLTFKPAELKKKRIVRLLKNSDTKSVTEGFKNTIAELESYFC